MYDCSTILRSIFVLVFNGIAGASSGQWCSKGKPPPLRPFSSLGIILFLFLFLFHNVVEAHCHVA